jgi:RNA polymerase sigma-70 factor (ECF subfamily)
MSSNSSDGTYVRRVQAGNREAFRTLVERYEGMVFDLTHQYGNDTADSEDLAQDIFIKAYRRIDRIDDPERFASWLYTIALNHCRDYAKNVRRQTYAFSRTDIEAEDQFQPGFSPAEGLEMEEENSRLWQAIAQLKPGYSTPLLLKYRDGLSYRAIAGRMDVSVSALKVRVHRARKQLKSILNDAI